MGIMERVKKNLDTEHRLEKRWPKLRSETIFSDSVARWTPSNPPDCDGNDKYMEDFDVFYKNNWLFVAKDGSVFWFRKAGQYDWR